MAIITPLFDTVINGTGTTQTETWVDLGLIPNGKQLWLGYATYAGVDKNTQFETRCNTSGTSTGTLGNTTLLDWTASQAGSSVDRDFYQNGNIMVTTLTSTGVEHLWLRVLTQSSAVGQFDYILRYMIY